MITKVNNSLTTLVSAINDEKARKNEKSFMDFLKNYVSDVNEKQIDANKAIERFVKGEDTDITNTVLAMEKADVSLQLFLQIKNKVLQAYQEIMRMQV